VGTHSGSLNGCGAESSTENRGADDKPVCIVGKSEDEAEPIALLCVISEGESYCEDDE